MSNDKNVLRSEFRRNQIIAYIALEDSPPLGSILTLESSEGESVTMKYEGGSTEGTEIMIWGPELKESDTVA